MWKRAYIANLCPLRLLMTVWIAIVMALALPARALQPDASQQTDSSPQPQPVDAPADNSTETMFPHFKGTRYWLSGQANFIFQTHPGFHALYSGKNSLSPHYEKATSRVLTLYTGLRLNNSTELLVDIEEAGGSALSTGLGVAGAPNLDIVRNPLLSKAPYLGRGMIHKVFALSRDKVENTRSFLSLFDELPRRRRLGFMAHLNFPGHSQCADRVLSLTHGMPATCENKCLASASVSPTKGSRCDAARKKSFAPQSRGTC